MILAEVGDFTRFDSPDKLLAYAGMSPSTYQSGQLKTDYPHMEKRGSRYLRYALYNATKYVCHWDPAFADYLAKKRLRGNTTTSHFPMLQKIGAFDFRYGKVTETLLSHFLNLCSCPLVPSFVDFVNSGNRRDLP